MTTEKEPKRKLFNKGGRRIDFTRGEDDKKETLSLHPQKSAEFSATEATKLLRLYPSELIDMNNVTDESLTSTVIAGRLASDQKGHDEEIAKRLEAARAARAQAAFEDALKEGFHEAEAREIAGLPAEEPKDDLEG